MLLLHANKHVRQRRKHPDVGFPVAFIGIRHQDIFETAIWKLFFLKNYCISKQNSAFRQSLLIEVMAIYK